MISSSYAKEMTQQRRMMDSDALQKHLMMQIADNLHGICDELQRIRETLETQAHIAGTRHGSFGG